MTSHFSSDFFSRNRRNLQAEIEQDALIVLAGHGLLQRTADSGFAFHQESNFWYLSGLDEPDLVLVLAEAEEFLIVPGRDNTRQAFDGAVDLSGLSKRSGITRIKDEKAGWQRLRELLKTHSRVFSLDSAPAYDKRHGLWSNPANQRLRSRLKRLRPDLHIETLDATLANLRIRKQPEELAALQAAINITTATLHDVQSHLTNYRHEYELEAAISHGFRSRGAAGHGFAPIVANGAAATVLHNVSNNQPIASGKLTVVDVGAEVEHYAADVTRTFAVSPTKRQRDVHAAVCEVQAYALSLLKPGALMRDYERQVGLFLGKQLQQLGLIEHIDTAAVRPYYPHATSHFLGLDVHDVGDYRQPLEPGMVLTCEPGIYIPAEGIGVRIEDDVLITETGHSVLSASCPRELPPVQ